MGVTKSRIRDGGVTLDYPAGPTVITRVLIKGRPQGQCQREEV